MSGVEREFVGDLALCYFPSYTLGNAAAVTAALPAPGSTPDAASPAKGSTEPSAVADADGEQQPPPSVLDPAVEGSDSGTGEETSSSAMTAPTGSGAAEDPLATMCDIVVNRDLQRKETQLLDSMSLRLSELALVGDVLPVDAPRWQFLRRQNARLRFLRARKYDVDAAIEQYTKALAWRQQVHADHILDTPDPDELVYQCVCSHRHHGFDRQGHPLYFEKSGSVRMPEFFAHVKEEDLVTRHVRMMEYAFRRCEYSSMKNQRNVEKIVMVHDLANLQFTVETAALRVFKATTRIDQDYYPERLSRMIIINAPLSFRGLWAMIRPWLDPKTAAKVIILGTKYQGKLRELIADDQLPAEYGGQCRCYYPRNADGCMPTLGRKVATDAATATSAWYDIRVPPPAEDPDPVLQRTPPPPVEGAATPSKSGGWFGWMGRKT